MNPKTPRSLGLATNPRTTEIRLRFRAHAGGISSRSARCAFILRRRAEPRRLHWVENAGSGLLRRVGGARFERGFWVGNFLGCVHGEQHVVAEVVAAVHPVAIKIEEDLSTVGQP